MAVDQWDVLVDSSARRLHEAGTDGRIPRSAMIASAATIASFAGLLLAGASLLTRVIFQGAGVAQLTTVAAVTIIGTGAGSWFAQPYMVRVFAKGKFGRAFRDRGW